METLASTTRESWLSWALRGILVVGFVLLFIRLAELQIVKGSYFRALADGNRIRKIPIASARGRILARGGEILADNKEQKKAIKFNPESGFEKSDVVGEANPDEIISEWERVYPQGDKFAHLTGYLGQVNEKEVGTINPGCPEKGVRQAGSQIGREGLEQKYDCVLSGIDGEELLEVDTRGKKVRTLGIRQPVPGRDLKTWIDFGLQQKVAEVMNGKKGAVIATDVGGEVLALYSSPSFDPNKNVSELLTDSNLPLFNRAIGGLFHPGSVFKPFVAIAALSEGKITKDFIFEDPGVINIGKFSYSNWFFSQYGATEGKINVVRALARSTDTFFYKIGEMVGVDDMVTWANTFGLGGETGIDLPGEVGGLIPSPAWKLKVIGEPWFLGNTYHMSIGQGDLSLTPVELHRGILAIANSGNLCSLKIASDPSCKKLKVDKANLNIVKSGMIDACATGGTGFTFFDFKPKSLPAGRQVACKTGTAETNVDGKTHAWFVVFLPADATHQALQAGAPDSIVLTVLIERGGEGSKVAGPIAREIMDYWFGREVK